MKIRYLMRVLIITLCMMLMCSNVYAAGGNYEKTIPKVLSRLIMQPTMQPTMKDFMKIAIQPIGKTMYVWGGAWNEADNGSGIEAVSIGLSPQWESFYKIQNAKYNYNTTRYQIHNGLDCSGYVGWTIYNLFNKENGKEGYVMKSTVMAQNFADRGWGTYSNAANLKKYIPGSIMNTKGHVFILLGQCPDGSLVLVHSSPPGVKISGTASSSGNKKSQAVALASKYMKQYYPEWYAKYPYCGTSKEYLTAYGQMAWDVSGKGVLQDPDGITKMNAEQVLSLLFSN